MLVSHRARAHLVLIALSSAALVRCSCEEDPVFVPGVAYEPGDTLNFGEVSVDQELTLDITVRSNGGAALVISSLTFPGADPTMLGKFAFEGQACAPDAACTSLKPDLLAGVAPSSTSSISITYRPCPDAWNGDALKPDYDFSTCPTGNDVVEMTINDNSRDQTRTITLTGQPAQQPDIQVLCNNSANQCGKSIDPMFVGQCNTLSFGSVTAGGMPCDIEIEVRNVRRQGKPTGALIVERVDILVATIDPPITQVDGRTVGFTLLDSAGAPLVFPVTVPIAVGQPQGSQRFKVRFDGSGNGLWLGDRGSDRGLRIYHNDPDADNRTVLGLGITADGAAPQITVLPSVIDFGPVEQGTTRTATIVVGNAGSAILEVGQLGFMTDQTGNRFRVTHDQGAGTGPFSIMPNVTAGARLFVEYTPVSAGQDRDVLLIPSNDPDEGRKEVPLSGGATPRISVEPRDTLVFELGNPPSSEPRTKDVTVANVGYGDLVIQRLDIVGPDGERDHSSVDDFSISYGTPAQTCASFPCDVSISLCPPSNAACQNPLDVIHVTYRNNDNSNIDLVTLRIYSTDPANPIYDVVLQAEDRPCFSPTPVILPTTPNPTAGSPVCLSCTSSSPGGPSGNPATIVSCDWTFAFAASSPIPAFMPNPGDAPCFTPTASGLHIVSLVVTNSCGVASSAATEVVTVGNR